MNGEAMLEDPSEVVTRGILREELTKQSETFDQRIDRRFAEFRELIRQDTQSAMGVLLSDFQRSLSLALESTYGVKDKVDKVDLLARVTRLENKVFPPKRTTRRRKSA